jgi:hypothetical protein
MKKAHRVMKLLKLSIADYRARKDSACFTKSMFQRVIFTSLSSIRRSGKYIYIVLVMQPALHPYGAESLSNINKALCGNVQSISITTSNRCLRVVPASKL